MQFKEKKKERTNKRERERERGGRGKGDALKHLIEALRMKLYQSIGYSQKYG